MSFAAGQARVWSVPPDWGTPVRETLACETEILRAPATGASQHLAGRIVPERSFAVALVSGDQERRLVDALVADCTGKPFETPIWPDVQLLGSAVASASTWIPCRTSGFDFRAGGKALLWRGLNSWVIVEVDVVETSGLTIVDALDADWPAGTRIYPLRRARLALDSRIRKITDRVDRPALRFTIDEPCDWPAVLPSVTYLGHPVLTSAGDGAGDGEVFYERMTEASGSDGGLRVDWDLAGVSLRTTPHVWELWGRAQQAEFRSLVYALHGRQVPIWVPTWSSDLFLLQNVGAADSTLTVEWCGYTLFGRMQPNRRDVRIELWDGTVFFRRLTNASEAGNTEVLTLSSALGQAVSAGSVRRISFMTLATLASDQIEIQHVTDSDGRARVVSPWAGVLPDV